jgi:hypothetical protein
MVKCGFSQNSRHLSAVIFYFFWVTEVKSWFFLPQDINMFSPSAYTPSQDGGGGWKPGGEQVGFRS